MWELFFYLVFYCIISFFIFYKWIINKNIFIKEKIFISILFISYIIHFFYIYPSLYFFWFLIYDIHIKMNTRSYKYKFYFFIFVFFIYFYININYTYFLPIFILIDFIFTTFLYLKNVYNLNTYKNIYAFLFKHKLKQYTSNFIIFSFLYFFYEFIIQFALKINYTFTTNFYQSYKDLFLLSDLFFYKYGFSVLYFMLILNILQFIFLDKIITIYSEKRILI